MTDNDCGLRGEGPIGEGTIGICVCIHPAILSLASRADLVSTVVWKIRLSALALVVSSSTGTIVVTAIEWFSAATLTMTMCVAGIHRRAEAYGWILPTVLIR